MLVRFLSCRERFRLKYICGLEPPDRWNHKMGYGTMWHVCEEWYGKIDRGNPSSLSSEERVTSYRWLQELERHVRDLNKRYPLQQDDIMKWFNVCRVQFPEYIKRWVDHQDTVIRKPLFQEQSFDVLYHLPSGRVVRLRGKWDSVDMLPAHTDEDGRHWPTGIWLQENKTKGDIDQEQVERQLKFDLQTMLYLIALQIEKDDCPPDVDGPNRKHPILGVRYNVVRRPLSGGKGNISPHKAKATKTKMTPAESPADFYERLRRDYIADDPGYWFFRIKCGISQTEIDTFRRTCLDPLLEHLCWWYDDVVNARPTDYRSYPPMNYRTPFGVWSALEEGGATEYDQCLATGSEVGLRRVDKLFTELE